MFIVFWGLFNDSVYIIYHWQNSLICRQSITVLWIIVLFIFGLFINFTLYHLDSSKILPLKHITATTSTTRKILILIHLCNTWVYMMNCNRLLKRYKYLQRSHLSQFGVRLGKKISPNSVFIMLVSYGQGNECLVMVRWCDEWQNQWHAFAWLASLYYTYNYMCFGFYTSTCRSLTQWMNTHTF